MKEERFIDGRRCRVYSSERYYMHNCCSGKRFWVADTGDFVAYESQDDGELIPCEMGCSRSGPYIEEMGDEGYLDSIVMALFGPPQPDRDVHSRHLPMINHIDGNWMNCNINNLEWIPYHYRHSTAYREFVDYDGYNIFEVHLTGDVMLDGIELSVSSQVISRAFSNDFYLALFIDDNHAPHIKVEELMAKAGYVQGDDANLVHPVILHIDGDYKNCNANNLEWVEEYDPRYINYVRKRDLVLQSEKMMEFKSKNPWQDEWDIDEQPEDDQPAPFTPPSFSSHGEASDRGENPFKPI